MPQSQPALQGYRSVGPALKRLRERTGRFLRLTVETLWSKIITRAQKSRFERSSRRTNSPKIPYMSGPKEDYILMMVGGLTLDPTTKMPIVVLKDPDNKLNLPIWIGPLEAASMATELEGIKPQRPMTHDLLRNILSEFGATVEAIEITELRDNTYFARIEVKTGEGKSIHLDSRPSDAISVALRTKSPIYVAKAVLEASSELHESAEQQAATMDQNLASVSRDKWSEILEKMSPEDFKYKM